MNLNIKIDILTLFPNFFEGFLNESIIKRAIAKKDKAQAEANLKTAIKRIDKAAGAGVIAKNTSARKKSRLTKKVNAME